MWSRLGDRLLEGSSLDFQSLDLIRGPRRWWYGGMRGNEGDGGS